MDELPNDLYDADTYRRIADTVINDYECDETDREEWMQSVKEALKLAKQSFKDKTFPYQGASNVKLPLVLDASVKFASRAYAEIIAKDGVVKVKTLSESPEKLQRAKRVTDYMNYQLLCVEEEWETDTDQLLHMLPVVGHMFRKRFFCPRKNRTDSKLITPEYIACSKDGRRKTQIHTMSYSEIVAMQRAAGWREVDLVPHTEDDSMRAKMFEELHTKEFTVYEQHCYMDLDDDVYEEPIIAIVDKDSRQVLYVGKRYDEENVKYNSSEEIVYIEPNESFIDYRFIPDPAGCYYGIGFGHMMGPLTKAANSLINQLVDAGTLNNVQGGFIGDNVDILSGRHQFQLGEWKKVKLSGATKGRLGDSILPLPTKEPSPTLFSLLGLLIDLNKDIASIKDALTGENVGSNVAATTTVALIEQGMKTFNTIYKRIYKALTKEFKILYKINGTYLDTEEEYELDDQELVATRADFQAKGISVIPTADPAMASDMQRLTKAEAMKNTIGLFPGIDVIPIIENYYRALHVDEKAIQQIMAPLIQARDNPQPPQPPMEVMAMMQQTQIEEGKLQIQEGKLQIDQMNARIKEREVAIEEQKAELERMKIASEALRNISTAEAAEKGSQIKQYESELKGLANETERMASKSSDTTSTTGNRRGTRPTIGDSGIS